MKRKLFLQLMLSVWWMVDDLTILRKLTFGYFLGIRPPPTTLTKIADKKLIEHDSCWLHLSENTLHPMVLVHYVRVQWHQQIKKSVIDHGGYIEDIFSH